MSAPIPDSSAVIAAVSQWHDAHERALLALDGLDVIVGHCLLEVYSVLTRLPEPARLPAELAAAVLAARFTAVLTLPDDVVLGVPSRLHDAGVSGGATYDGVIALTAVHHGYRLLTLDARASGTYRRCGAEFEII